MTRASQTPRAALSIGMTGRKRRKENASLSSSERARSSRVPFSMRRVSASSCARAAAGSKQQSTASRLQRQALRRGTPSSRSGRLRQRLRGQHQSANRPPGPSKPRTLDSSSSTAVCMAIFPFPVCSTHALLVHSRPPATCMPTQRLSDHRRAARSPCWKSHCRSGNFAMCIPSSLNFPLHAIPTAPTRQHQPPRPRKMVRVARALAVHLQLLILPDTELCALLIRKHFS